MEYDVWCPDLGSGPEDARVIEAPWADQAAEAWARFEDAWGADYWIVGGTNATVCVRERGSQKVLTFIVSGYSEAVYRATMTAPTKE